MVLLCVGLLRAKPLDLNEAPQVLQKMMKKGGRIVTKREWVDWDVDSEVQLQVRWVVWDRWYCLQRVV